MSIACPNKNDPDYKEMVAKFGPITALAMWSEEFNQLIQIEKQKVIDFRSNTIFESLADKNQHYRRLDKELGLPINKAIDSNNLLEYLSDKNYFDNFTKDLANKFKTLKPIDIYLHKFMQIKSNGLIVEGSNSNFGISLNALSNPGQFGSVLIHELTHAYTRKAIEKPTVQQQPIVNELQQMFNYLKPLSPNMYEMTNLHEFVAGVYGNKEFRQYLQGIDVSYYNSAVKGTMFDYLKLLFARLLGIDVNALDFTLKRIPYIISDDYVVNNGKNHLEAVNDKYNFDKFDLTYWKDGKHKQQTLDNDIISNIDDFLLEYYDYKNDSLYNFPDLTEEENNQVRIALNYSLKENQWNKFLTNKGIIKGLFENNQIKTSDNYELTKETRKIYERTNKKVEGEVLPNSILNYSDYESFIKGQEIAISNLLTKDNRLEQVIPVAEIKNTSSIKNYNNYVHSTLFDEVLNLFKKKFPKIKIVSDYYNESWNSKIDNGVVYVNLNKVRPDSLIDEYGHIWFAILKQEDPETAKMLLDEMKLTSDFNNLKETVYSLVYKDDDSIAEEAFIKLVMKKFTNTKEKSLIKDYYDSLLDILKKFFGIKDTIKDLVLKAADDLMKNPSEINSDILAKMITEVKYNLTTIPSNSAQLIEFISDKDFDLTERFIKRKTEDILNTHEDGTFFMNKTDKAKNETSFSFDTKASIEDQRKEIGASIKNYYEKILNDSVDFIKETFNNNTFDKTDPDENRQRLKNVLSAIYPDFDSRTDKIITYADMMREYNIGNAAFDDKHILVVVKNYASIRSFSILTITGGRLGESKSDKSIISGISKKWGTFFGSMIVKYANDIKLTNSLESRAEILANLAAMSLVNEGLTVNNVIIGNLSIKYDPNFKHSDSASIIPEIKNLFNIEIIKEQLDTVFVKLLGNKKVFDVNNYKRSFIQDLIDLPTSDFSIELIKDDLQAYREGKIDVFTELRQKIERKLNQLSNSEKVNMNSLENSAEFVLLLQALKELSHSKHNTLNEYTKQDSILQWTTALTSITNPYINWWVEMWNKSRNLVITSFEKFQKERNAVFALLEKDPANSNLLYDNRSAVYKDLFVFVDGINTFTLKVPGSAEYNSLSQDKQKFIVGFMDILKGIYRTSWDLRNFDKTDTDFDTDWEASSWANGRIPLVRSSFTSQLYSKKSVKAFETMFEELLNENMNYEEKYNNYDSLQNQIYAQASLATHNDRLGDNFEYADNFETDLNRIINLFAMQTYKHKHMSGLIGIWKGARTMMSIKEKELGLEDGGGKQSEDIELLDAIVKALIFNEKGKLPKGLGTNINKAINAASTITTWAALGINPLTSITSFASNIAGLTLRVLAGGFDYSITDITNAATGILTGKDFDKAMALGQHLRLIATDEFDMIHNRKQANERMSILDMRWNWFLDRGFDSFIKMMMLTAKLKKQGYWDAYDDKGNFDETKAFQGKDGELIKQHIKTNLIKEGVMTSEEPMPSAYDNALRTSLEKEISEVIGGYTDATKTRAGFHVFGMAISKFRTYQLGRIERALIGRGTDAGKVDYRVEDGEVKQDVAVSGILQSFRKAFANVAYYKSLDARALNNLTDTDKKNIRVTTAFLSTSLMMFMIGSLDDEERNKRKKRSIYDNIVSDLSTTDNIRSAWKILENPLVSVAYMTKLSEMTYNYLTFDFKEANESAFKNLGFLRTLSYVKESFK